MTVDTSSSFVKFVYPINFNGQSFDDRVNVVKAAQWTIAGKTANVWRVERFQSDDFLPHVAAYLNPKDAIHHDQPDGREQGDVMPATAWLFALSEDVLNAQDGLGSGRRQNRVKWTLEARTKSIPFLVANVEFILFRIGVGFIVVTALPIGDSPDSWHDFMHFFRFVKGQREVSVKGETKTGFNQETRTPIVEAYFPACAGGLSGHPEGRGTYHEILGALLLTGSLSAEGPPWYSEGTIPGQLMPFACFYVDGATEEEIPSELYRVRNFFHSRQELHAAPDDLRLDHPAHLPYAGNQWFLFTLDGGAFVACNAPNSEFFRRTMPDHVSRQYFLLFLLVLHQRCVLMELSAQVAGHWVIGAKKGEAERRERYFTRIRDNLLSFTARGFFTQVMQREHHHRCYRKWQETFQVDRLYQEVSDEVREMYNTALMWRTEKLEDRVKALTFFVGIPSLLLSFLGINLRGINTGDGMELWSALLLGIGGGLFVATILFWFFGRSRSVRE